MSLSSPVSRRIDCGSFFVFEGFCRLLVFCGMFTVFRGDEFSERVQSVVSFRTLYYDFFVAKNGESNP